MLSLRYIKMELFGILCKKKSDLKKKNPLKNRMEPVLTKQNLRSKTFLRDGVFRCTRRGGEDSTDEDWMFNTYTSIAVENGIDLGIRDANKMFRIINPFTDRIFRRTFYCRESINSDYIISFQITIVTESGYVDVGEFYYRSDRNPFEPKMEGLERNLNLYRHLDQSFHISIDTKFFRLPPTHNPDDVESSSSPKPPKKTFKVDQCAICLDRIPNVLFVKCRHICVCSVCEKAHPSTQCPCCRTEISEKLLI